MASILDKYGIKEVADVVFYKIDETTGDPTNPVLYLDTLKVSTIEQTGEQAEAKGGKGNLPLIIWDYGKEINVTLEDALFSAKSMAVMFGDGTVAQGTAAETQLRHTEEWMPADSTAASTAPTTFTMGGKTIAYASATVYDATGASVTQFTAGTKYFVTGLYNVTNVGTININPDSFPGTYYITGDTYARSYISGTDEFFQFIIPKAKVQSENTITMEAEGDPSVFNLSLRVMRPDSGEMMKLVKYDATAVSG